MFKRFAKSLAAPLADVLNEKLAEIQTVVESVTTSEQAMPPTEYLERLESLERRMERLQEEVLRHLQMASQRLKRAERLNEQNDDEDDDEAPQMSIPIPQPEDTLEDDLTYLARAVAQRGETAVI